MPLTREQFQGLRDKGLNVQQIVSFEKGETPQGIARQKQVQQETSGNQFAFDASEPTPDELGRGDTKTGKVRGAFTKLFGGGKLAEGIGGAIAAPFVQKTLDTEQRQTEELQGKLLQAIRAAKSEGRDTSRLEKAMRNSQDLATTLNDVQKDFAESLPTSKEVIGSSVRLATTLGSGLIGRASAKALALGKSTTFLGGAARGTGAGALSGAVIGGLQGAGVGAEQDKSAADIAKSAGIGAGAGAAVGGVLGTVLGGVSGSLKGRAITKAQQLEDIVSPKVTSKVGSEAIARGELQDPTILGAARLTPSTRTKDVANSVRGVVNPKASTSQNVDAIQEALTKTNSGVKKYVTDNNVIFNRGELRNALNSGKDELDLLFTSDALAEKTYNKVVAKAMEQVDVNDIESLLSGRKSFDQLPAVQKLLNNDRVGENTKREIVLAVRRAANKYIASRLPEGNTFRADLLKQHNMLEALGNISEKAFAQLGKNKIQLLNEKYPLMKWFIGAGLLGAGGVGVGGAAIASTD